MPSLRSMTPTTRIHPRAGHASGGHRRREHQGRLAGRDVAATVSRPFEVWRDRDALAAVLREVAAEVAGGRPTPWRSP